MHWTLASKSPCLLAACLCVLGCEKQKAYDPTFPANGAVTLDQKPLADGTIAFITPETGDLQAISIRDGRFEGQVRAGKRRVEIRAYPEQKERPSPMIPPRRNYLPTQYNSASTLSAEVTATGPNVFDFNLKSK